MVTATDLDQAFGEFTKEIVEKVKKVNAACSEIKKKFPNPIITLDGRYDTMSGNGVLIREYENAMEELKEFIENRNSDAKHNLHLKRIVLSGETFNRHAIRALEVELVHPEADNELLKEWMITGVRVRGFISEDPSDGNELPNFSSISSSSSVSTTQT